MRDGRKEKGVRLAVESGEEVKVKLVFLFALHRLAQVNTLCILDPFENAVFFIKPENIKIRCDICGGRYISNDAYSSCDAVGRCPIFEFKLRFKSRFRFCATTSLASDVIVA